MGTEGNGSTPKKFDHGLVAPQPRVEDSPLWQTQQGRMFISECLDRHISGDWGETLPHWIRMINDRFASNEGIASGGLVAGIYKIPEALQMDADDDHLNIVTTTFAPIVDIPELRAVTTLLLILSDLSD